MRRQFFSALMGVVAATGAILFLLDSLFPEFQAHRLFAAIGIALFTGICLALFYVGSAAAESKNKYAFNQLILISVFGKLVCSLLLVFSYAKFFTPPNNAFVAIFILIYALFTAFEVWFMMRLARGGH